MYEKSIRLSHRKGKKEKEQEEKEQEEKEKEKEKEHKSLENVGGFGASQDAFAALAPNIINTNDTDFSNLLDVSEKRYMRGENRQELDENVA
jgi:hypothetical protein